MYLLYAQNVNTFICDFKVSTNIGTLKILKMICTVTFIVNICLNLTLYPYIGHE